MCCSFYTDPTTVWAWTTTTTTKTITLPPHRDFRRPAAVRQHGRGQARKANLCTDEATATKSALTEKEEEEEAGAAMTTESTPSTSKPKPERSLDVSSRLELPFPVELAYDTFSNLTRQPEWSPWLHSVDYVSDDENENENNDTESTLDSTKWTLKVMGVSYSWISIATVQDRPYVIEWESISGLKNYGRVVFERKNNHYKLNDEYTTTWSSSLSSCCCCIMTMTMTFVPPRLVTAIFRNPNGIKRFMEHKLIGSSLETFRDVVLETLLGGENATLFFPI